MFDSFYFKTNSLKLELSVTTLSVRPLLLTYREYTNIYLLFYIHLVYWCLPSKLLSDLVSYNNHILTTGLALLFLLKCQYHMLFLLQFYLLLLYNTLQWGYAFFRVNTLNIPHTNDDICFYLYKRLVINKCFHSYVKYLYSFWIGNTLIMCDQHWYFL